MTPEEAKRLYDRQLYKTSAKRRVDLKESQRKWRIKNPEKWKAITYKAVKKYQKAHPEKIREIARRSAKKRYWRIKLLKKYD